VSTSDMITCKVFFFFLKDPRQGRSAPFNFWGSRVVDHQCSAVKHRLIFSSDGRRVGSDHADMRPEDQTASSEIRTPVSRTDSVAKERKTVPRHNSAANRLPLKALQRVFIFQEKKLDSQKKGKKNLTTKASRHHAVYCLQLTHTVSFANACSHSLPSGPRVRDWDTPLLSILNVSVPFHLLLFFSIKRKLYVRSVC
jgi:hypothetical protein